MVRILLEEFVDRLLDPSIDPSSQGGTTAVARRGMGDPSEGPKHRPFPREDEGFAPQVPPDAFGHGQGVAPNQTPEHFP